MQEEEVKEVPVKTVRAKAEPQQKAVYSLPPVAMKRGGMNAFDLEILKQQQDAINKLSIAQEEEQQNPAKDPYEGLTMAEVLR